MKRTLVVIDANIGCGKSSLISNMLETYPNILVPILEPVKEFEKRLVEYYLNPKKYAYKFQKDWMTHKITKLKELTRNDKSYKIFIMERSFNSDFECFIKTHFEKGNISEKQMEKLERRLKKIIGYINDKFEVKSILIDSSGKEKELEKRIRRRDRKEDKMIDLSYLEYLRKYFDPSNYDIVLDLEDIYSSFVSKKINSKLVKFIMGFGEPGKIVIVCGPMFAGKTTTLIDKYYDEKNTIAFKHKIDERYGSNIKSHDGKEIDAISVYDAFEILEHDLLENIIIDEGHFFSNIDVVVDYLFRRGHNIYISMLNSTYDRKWFTESANNLYAIATKIKYVRGKCECKKKSCYSKMIMFEDAKTKIIPGGVGIYKPCCKHCFFEDN